MFVCEKCCDDVKAKVYFNVEECVLDVLVGKIVSFVMCDSFCKKLCNGEMDDKEIEIEVVDIGFGLFDLVVSGGGIGG
ncbi:hypothetical protein DF186_14020 [Enterococcus hirae]|nr:hypothetical protein DF186_14020 [Enterococcus hirae]